MRVLDLYCGAGLVARGLIKAGFEVVGVDNLPMPRYPGPFLQHDALTLDMRFLRSFDAIWASPPCQASSAMKTAPGAKAHVDLIPRTRLMLMETGLPWVIENVEGARLYNPTTLCGSMFGLGVLEYQLRRHRLFEANFPIPQPVCKHRSPVIGIYGGHVRNRAASSGGRQTADFKGLNKKALAMVAMDVPDLLTFDEISQGIPPAYAQHVGDALMAHLDQRWAAGMTNGL